MWQQAVDGRWIYIIDYPEMIKPDHDIDMNREEVRKLMSDISEMMKKYDIKLIANGKEF
jgi:hypothetical protein